MIYGLNAGGDLFVPIDLHSFVLHVVIVHICACVNPVLIFSDLSTIRIIIYTAVALPIGLHCIAGRLGTGFAFLSHPSFGLIKLCSGIRCSSRMSFWSSHEIIMLAMDRQWGS